MNFPHPLLSLLSVSLSPRSSGFVYISWTFLLLLRVFCCWLGRRENLKLARTAARRKENDLLLMRQSGASHDCLMRDLFVLCCQKMCRIGWETSGFGWKEGESARSTRASQLQLCVPNSLMTSIKRDVDILRREINVLVGRHHHQSVWP